MKPMLASPLKGATFDQAVLRYVNDDRWALEEKLDGDRLLVDLSAGAVFLNRDGTPADRGRLPGALGRFLRPFKAAPMALDGEVVAGLFNVFDVVWPAGDIRTYSERRAVAEALFDNWQPDPDVITLVRSAVTVEDKALLAQQVIADHGEGMIAKQLDSMYQPGRRADSWVKLKHVKDAEFVVTRLAVAGKDNMALGVRRDGKLVEVGECSALTGDGPRIKRIIHDAGYQPGDDVTDLGVVVTVTFLYVGVNGRLVQPVKPRLRVDKPAAQCTFDQLPIPKGSNAHVP